MKPTHLTVIFYDASALVCVGEPVSHRRVTLSLTAEQRCKLVPRNTGTFGGKPTGENIGTCFLEELP